MMDKNVHRWRNLLYSPYLNLLDYGTDKYLFLMIKKRWSKNIMNEKHLSITDICIQIKNF